jgi:hypothetical protein
MLALTSSSSISRARLDQHLAGDGVDDVLERHAAEDALAERLDDLAALFELHLQMPSRVPQSNSVTTASCATSTRRRVR